MLNQLFISYRHESPEHKKAVRQLGELLRRAQIPVALDDFFLDEHPGGPDEGWPKWCEDCANQSQCVLIIASEGWFAAYDKLPPADRGFGAAAEADLFRQDLWDQKGNNDRIRIGFLHDVEANKVPVRLRPWHQFRLFDHPEDLDQLIRWLAGCLGLPGLALPASTWPDPIAFQPDLANRDIEEWPAVVNLLAGRSRERILLFEGCSGVGKSALVRQAAAYGKILGITVAPVNFKGGALSVDATLGQIGLELGANLPNFSREGSNKTHLLCKDLRALRQPVLLIFDHYEDAAENKPLADWFNQQLLAEIENSLSVAVIVAGQRLPDFTKAGWRDLARQIQLARISEFEPWRNWASRRYPALHAEGHLRTAVILAEGLPSTLVGFCEALAKSTKS
jgi:hypothetical protein